MSTLKIETPHLALFMARRNSGKTTLMKYLLGVLARGKRFRWVSIVSATSFNREWQAVVGDRHVLPEFDPEWLDALLRRQAALKADGVSTTIASARRTFTLTSSRGSPALVATTA